MPSTIAAGAYAIDPAHSNVGFEIKHMAIATVRGHFDDFQGAISSDGTGVSFAGTVEVASIDTANADRDGHLKSGDFFDVDAHPQISFTSSSAQIDGEGLSLDGDITIKGVTQPVSFTGTISEPTEDPWGNERVGVEVSAKLDRAAFGLDFSQTVPGGNALVGNQVKLVISISAVKSTTAPQA